MNKTLVFVPFSPRSFDGIAADVIRAMPDAEVIALVIEGEVPPDGMRHLLVSKTGHFGLFAFEQGTTLSVVANGGPTPLGVGAVLLSQRLGCKLLNVQRDGVVEINNDPAY